MKVKICGQTSLKDCEMSVNHGADYLGVVLDVKWSPRSLDIGKASPIFERFGDMTFLLVFNREADAGLVEAVERLGPCALQLTGKEPPEKVGEYKSRIKAPIYKSIHLSPAGQGRDEPELVVEMMRAYAAAGADGFMLDTASNGMFGGTGKKSDWSVASAIVAAAPRPVFLAGGINPDNVAEAASVPGIFGIDLASGVESEKGVKSDEKLKALFENLARGRTEFYV